MDAKDLAYPASPWFSMENAAPRSKKIRSLGAIAVVGLVVLLLVIDMRRRAAESQLAQLSVRLEQLTGGNQAQNQQAAKLIVEQVRKLYNLPEGVEPTVATIVDVNELRKRNAFYNKAKNGDYLVVTSDRAILFDATANKILDVVPVQIEQPTASSAAGQ